MSVGTAQVVTLLENVLFESPALAQANAAIWVTTSQAVPGDGTVAELAAAMAASPEAGIVDQVVRYYEGALGRAPSGFEINYYVNIVETGLSASQIALGATAVPQASWNIIAADFANSPEFQTISANTNLITLLYLNILGREPSASEVAFYQAQLDQGGTAALLVQEFTNSPEFQNDVALDIRTALANYGAAVASGTTPSTIPLATTPHVTTATLGADPLTVTGGLVTQTINVVGTPQAAAQAAVTAVTGVIGVTAVAAATGVQGVTAVAAVTPVTGQSAVTANSDGAATVNDYAFAGGGAGTVTTVNLIDSGAGSVINDNALSNLGMTGTAGTVTINNNTAGSLVLTLTANGLSAADNTITDSNGEVATLDIVTTTADSTLTAFVDPKLTKLTVSGTNTLTLSTINATLTALDVTGAAGFSDGAHIHGSGLAALGAHLTITDSSTGRFSAVLDDTTQSFTGGAGIDVITVSALTDATETLTAGSSGANEIIFEGGTYALTSASTGKFVNFQTVGVDSDVTGTIDLAVIDPTASGLDVRGGDIVTFANVAATAGLTLEASSGATVTVKYAGTSGAADSATVTMSSAVASLTLRDMAGNGIGTVSFVDTLASGETNVSPAHVIASFTDNGLSTLNLSGTAGLTIAALNEAATPSASLTLNNGSTSGYGLTITGLTDTLLTTLAFAGTGVTSIGTLTDGAASLTVSNGGAALAQIGTLNDAALTALTLGANVALGQAATALTTNGLQDAATAGVTVTGGSDNAHVTVNLTAGAGTGMTDSITLGNGNDVVVDASTSGTVTLSLGSGANLVELGSASLDTTATYSVTLAARTATPPNAIIIGADGTNYATAPNLVVSGASTGDIIAFGGDTASSSAALTATDLTSVSSVAGAIGALEADATSAHDVVYGVYGGNTYIVETKSGTIGAADTTVVELEGTHTLTASTGYVTLGGTASTLSGGGLSGASFTIPAGTATNLTLGFGTNIVTLVGPSTGVTDTFTSIATTTALTVNYQATSGTDTIQMTGSGGGGKSDITSLIVNDSSIGSAGLTMGAFTDNALTAATYNDSAATGGVMTQSTLTSSSLNTINLTGGVAGMSTNTYFISATLTTQGSVTINDSNVGTGSTTMGLALNGGPSALTLDMTGADTLATGALSDNNLTTLNLTGSGVGQINIGTLSSAETGAFTVNDNDASTGAAVMILAGLSAANSLIVNDSAAGPLTDNSAYSDAALANLSLDNTGNAALTIGGGGITSNALTNVLIAGSGAGTITTGTLTDAGTAALTVIDSSLSTGLVTLPLDGISAASAITVIDSAAGGLTLGNIADNGLTGLALSNTGTSTLTAGTITANAMTNLTFAAGSAGVVTLGAISDTVAHAVVFNDNSASTAAVTLSIASLPNATGVTVNDSGPGALTVTPFTDSNAATLTFGNTGSALLTASDITDNAAALTVALTGSGTGTDAITLITGGATSLTITDSSTSTGASAVSVSGSLAVTTFTVTDSASGALGIGAFTDANLTTASLTNSGGGTLTLNSAGSGITAGTAFSGLTLQGSGAITTALTVPVDSGTVTISDTDSGTATLSALNVGAAATDTGTLTLSNSAGTLTVAGGSDYVTALNIINSGNTASSATSITLTDLATGALRVGLAGTGAMNVNLTDTTGAAMITQSGAANLNLTLTHDAITGDVITLGGGNNVLTLNDSTASDIVAVTLAGGTDSVTMTAGRTAGSAFSFSASPGSNLNVSPVTADKIVNYLADSGTVQGDTLALGVTTVLTTADAVTNPDNNTLWTVSHGMVSESGASLLNFIDTVRTITQAGGHAATSGVAGFSDGINTWIAYNDHAGHVAVIELVGFVALGIETGGADTAGFVHLV